MHDCYLGWRSEPRRILHRRQPEQPRIFAAELRGAFIPDCEGNGRGIQGVEQQQPARPQQAQTFLEHFRRLDILVNSAGVFTMGVVGDPDADIAALDRQQAINLNGVVAAVRAAVPLMADGGRIVSIGTMFASRAPFPGVGDYAASKAAVAAYSRAWARDLGPRGITVNTVQPGPINTEMNPETGDMAPLVKQMTALGRYGQPEEIAGVVAFLVGADAAYITGATLNVDGGQNS